MKNKLTEFVKGFDTRIRFLRGLPESGVVLDLGCGAGAYGMVMKRLHPAIILHGVDILPVDNVPSIYSYSMVDIENQLLPYPDNFFDAVFFNHVIEHLHSPFHLGKEINRVMKRGAVIYIETPNWTTTFIPSFGLHRGEPNRFNFYDDPTHLKPWIKNGLYDFLLHSCRLRPLKVVIARNWAKTPLDPLLALYGLLASKRSLVMSSLWNLWGWCIYGIGIKD